ncbi:MAG: NAD-dependent epimerase/dehydratase family protein [Phaeodactylibacter xiamenensis]|uniref:NAD-dependent epimerase/dehydratase family protein n=1 Tax=Phaeodactylibacter xiamenensis TaxID=1524460 RepID=UPI000695F4CA|nr:NAD-dependent epimerase/dehydratase family protein [Phaeodactylibacter xiamenensis]MCR9051384.1 NAD-dependent epimerase/dehydratase family protein [bacterium]
MSHSNLHTVLGASGAVGRAVIDELLNQGLPVRAVSRTMDKPGVASVPADLLHTEDAQRVIRGSSHVYLCVGLPYFEAVWKKDWPVLMRNVINACAANDARLIFLDNVYMYGPAPLQVPFDESHPQQPVSEKGKARKATLDLLKNAMDKGTVQAVIGRAADFYGPYATNSMLYVSFLERMLKGKAPQLLSPTDVPHTYTDTVDVGRALVTLALAEDAYGQAWHLPVNPPITMQEATTIFNQLLGTAFKARMIPFWLQRLIGLFVPPLREVWEMNYQFRYPYVMSDRKFRERFPEFEVTGYEEGLERMVKGFGSPKTLHRSIAGQEVGV